MAYIQEGDDPAFAARSSLRNGIAGLLLQPIGFVFSFLAIKDGLKSRKLGYKGVKAYIGIILGALNFISALYYSCLIIQRILH